MADWLHDIEVELRRAEQTANPGRIRTIARRIAGIAIQEIEQRNQKVQSGVDYIHSLRAFINLDGTPENVIAAAERLQTKLSENFVSPSIDPIGDAMIIVEFVKNQIAGDAAKSNNSKS